MFAQVAQAQNRMNVQGQLNNADGTPANGEFSVQFSIYNDSLSGAPLLTETQRLAIAESFFNTSLDVRSIPFDTLYWIGLSVDGGDELRPRLPLFSSPYSFSTRSLFGAENVVPSSGNVGFGTRRPQAPLHVVGDAQVDGTLEAGPYSGRSEPRRPGCRRHAQSTIAEGGVNITGGVLTFSDGSTQSTAGGGGGAFNGMLNNIPLIIKDAQGDTQIQLNPDGTSTHNGQETFSGGGVIKDASGITVVTLDENGISVVEANKRFQAPADGLRLEGLFEFADPPFFEGGFESGDTSTWGNTDVGVDSRTDVTGVRGENTQPNGVGVHGTTDHPNSTGVLGEASDPSSKAGLFNGIVEVNGDVNGTLNATVKNFKIAPRSIRRASTSSTPASRAPT